MTVPVSLQPYFDQISLPKKGSHKGQNGKLLIIGGSELFHAASRWSLDIASRFVDMVFYASVPENNQLIAQAKAEFWNGIVVDRTDLDSYLQEADAILIGPGMTREKRVEDAWTQALMSEQPDLDSLRAQIDWQHDTYAITNWLLAAFPAKKWVIDAGALQMVEPSLLHQNHLLTPHQREFELLLKKADWSGDFQPKPGQSHQLGGATILVKGDQDTLITPDETIAITGGNPGMTKGGTGDVLAGLVAALYTRHTPATAAIVASHVNKAAGDHLYQTVGPFFNASDLVRVIPEVIWQILDSDG